MADTIALDTAGVRATADLLVNAYKKLQDTPDLTVERGAASATARGFRDRVADALKVHAANRLALVSQLAAVSEQLRAAAADFEGLEEDTRSVLYQLESEAHSNANAVQAVVRGAGAVEAAVRGAGVGAILGAAPAGSGSVPEQSGP